MEPPFYLTGELNYWLGAEGHAKPEHQLLSKVSLGSGPAALVRAKCSHHCPVLLCKTGSEQACVTPNTPKEICSSYICAVLQHQCTAALVRAKCISHCSVLLCKTGSQHGCVTVITPLRICSSYKYTVTQHQCPAALVRAKCIPHSSLFLCKTGSRQALCHCKYTYGDLLFTQV